jgi:2-amino-4-hydroxy-6-hydroxymethyldihydropteridine diphosphokinase
LIALGSNRRGTGGLPKALITDLLSSAYFATQTVRVSAPPRERKSTGFARRREDAEKGKEPAALYVVAASRVLATAPVGPGTRSYANAVALIETDFDPPALLAHLKSIERAHGRRPGRRWGDRPLDLDIIGWSGGLWVSAGLCIPHSAFRERRFVLEPVVEIAPDWRDPVNHLTARQLLARLDRKRPRP